MTDDLRTRIAEILYSQNADEDWNGKTMTWEETSKAYRECWLHDADVLIRELGSDCVYRYACHRCGDFWFDKSERMQRFALLHGKAHDDD